MTAQIVVACIAPSLVLLGYFYLRTEAEPATLADGLWAYGAGILSGPLSLALYWGIERTGFYADLEAIDVVPDWKKFLYAVCAIGLVEEVSKLLACIAVVRLRSVRIDEPATAMVYAVATALGFASIENAYFMFHVEEPVWGRAITLPFNHVLFSSFWGVGLGLAMVERRGPLLVLEGLSLAVLYHGLYDYILLADETPHWLVAPLVLVLWLFVSLAIRRLLRWPAGDPGSASDTWDHPPPPA